MIKKIITTSVLTLGLAFIATAADDKGGDGKGKGKGGGDRAAAIMKADTDGNGKVSSEEFGKSKMAQGMNKRREGSADKFFAKADANKDGSIDKAEAEKAAAGGGKGKGKGKGKGGDGDK